MRRPDVDGVVPLDPIPERHRPMARAARQETGKPHGRCEYALIDPHRQPPAINTEVGSVSGIELSPSRRPRQGQTWIQRTRHTGVPLGKPRRGFVSNRSTPSSGSAAATLSETRIVLAGAAATSLAARLTAGP